MAHGTKRLVYPRAEEGRGPDNLDFSQAFKTSHLGEVLCNANPMEEKFLKQQFDVLDRAKRRRENTLFHYQRNFFIAQVFGKGLNPHLNRSTEQLTEDELDEPDTGPQADEEPEEPMSVLERIMHRGKSLIDLHRAKNQESESKAAEVKNKEKSNDEQSSTQENNQTTNQIVKENCLKTPQTGDHKENRSRLSGNSRRKSGSRLQEPKQQQKQESGLRPHLTRSQTSSELNSKRRQSQSLPTLTTHVELDEETVSQTSQQMVTPNRDKVQANYMQERAKSTSDLANTSSTRPGVFALPSIHNLNKPQPDVIDEEDDENTSTIEKVSVHTLTDHIGSSMAQRVRRNDIATLKRDPKRIFPKMKILLSSYDSDSPATFHQIMNLEDDEEERKCDWNKRNSVKSRGKQSGGTQHRDSVDNRLAINRFASKSARAPAIQTAENTQKIKLKIKSARDSQLSSAREKISINKLNTSAVQDKIQQQRLSARKDPRQVQRPMTQHERSRTRPTTQQQNRNVKTMRPSTQHGRLGANQHRRISESEDLPDCPEYTKSTTDQDKPGEANNGELWDEEALDEAANLNSQQQDLQLTESQRYIKMIQQLTAYLPEHLLATAEQQIREMSNTDQIMKFKKRMIEKNHQVMERDSRTDPRWQRLEGTLISSGKPDRWYKRHSAWYLDDS